jgi:DNA repair exonuclease SbcCD nuclease subunit
MKKPIALILTDTHITPNNIPLVESIFDQAIDVCEQYNIPRIIHDGDWFTSRSHQALECLLSVSEGIIDKINSKSIEQLGLQGNHDKTDQSRKEGYMSLFRDKITLFEDEGFVVIDGICCCFLPFFTDQEYLERLVNLIEKTAKFERKILFTHQSINGVRNNDGSLVEKDIEQEFFVDFDKVIVGHYHNRQRVGENIYYIGSTHQSKFGEDDRKGFTILYSDMSIKYIPTVYPKYIHLKVHVDDDDKIVQAIEEHKDSDDNVRITLIGDKDKSKAIHKTIFDDTGIDVRFNTMSESTLFDSPIDEASGEAKVFNKKDLAKHWIKYCTSQSVPAYQRNEGLKFYT